jgi:hypothetical protein
MKSGLLGEEQTSQNTTADRLVCQDQFTIWADYLLFAAASSCRTFAMVSCDGSLRFLFFARRFGLVL